MTVWYMKMLVNIHKFLFDIKATKKIQRHILKHTKSIRIINIFLNEITTQSKFLNDNSLQTLLELIPYTKIVAGEGLNG